MNETLPSWAPGGSSRRSPFAFPEGWRGRAAGWFMARTNRQDELVPLLDLRPGVRVVEVGSGPGRLLELLLSDSRPARLRGVDPSSVMIDQAARRNRAAVAAGRLELTRGDAQETGLRAASADRVVSVNTIALWPDLDAGLREFHRITAPDGLAVIAWHGGHDPNRIARGLRLPAAALNTLEQGLRSLFGDVGRTRTTTLDVFTARCPR